MFNMLRIDALCLNKHVLNYIHEECIALATYNTDLFCEMCAPFIEYKREQNDHYSTRIWSYNFQPSYNQVTA